MRCRPPVASYALRRRSATCTTRPVRSWDSDAEVQAAIRDLFAACKFQQWPIIVGDPCACWTGEREDFDVAKAGLPTPTCEIATGEVERVTEFDEHVERHHQPGHVLAAESSISSWMTMNAPPSGSAS